MAALSFTLDKNTYLFCEELSGLDRGIVVKIFCVDLSGTRIIKKKRRWGLGLFYHAPLFHSLYFSY